MAERICTTFVDGCVFGEGSRRDSLLKKSILYIYIYTILVVTVSGWGGGSKFHTHFWTLAQMIFLNWRWDQNLGWGHGLFATSNRLFGKKRLNCFSLLFFRELKCKQCSSFWRLQVSVAHSVFLGDEQMPYCPRRRQRWSRRSKRKSVMRNLLSATGWKHVALMLCQMFLDTADAPVWRLKFPHNHWLWNLHCQWKLAFDPS